MRKNTNLKPRKLPSQLRSMEKVDRILDATARILSQHGLDGTNTNLIAEEAGISIGSLYQYFPNRDSIIAKLIERYMEGQKEIVTKRLAKIKEGIEIDTFFHELISSLLEARIKNPELHRVLVREIPRTGKMDELLDLESHLSDLFFERLNLLKNPFNREKLESRTLLMVHVVDAMLSSYTLKMKNRIPRKEFVNEVTNLIVTYLNSQA